MGTRESLNGREKNGAKKSKNGEKHSVLYFSSCHFSAHLDFPSLPLSAPGSPRMMAYFRKKKILLISCLGPMSVLIELLDLAYTNVHDSEVTSSFCISSFLSTWSIPGVITH